MTRPASVYRVFSEAGELLYIGRSVSAFARVAQHAAEKEWWGEVVTIKVQQFATLAEACAAEADAIANENPRHNVRRRGLALTDDELQKRRETRARHRHERAARDATPDERLTGLERLRLDSLLTVVDLAKQAGVAAGTVRRVEAGKPVQVGKLGKLAEFFDVPASVLVRPAPEPVDKTEAAA